VACFACIPLGLICGWTGIVVVGTRARKFGCLVNKQTLAEFSFFIKRRSAFLNLLSKRF
jgi:hypothetical protein